VVDEQYIGDQQALFDKILRFAKEVIFNPITENGSFKKEYVEQEKETLKDLINGLMNNKVSYAVERCFQEMCKNEPFSIYELGNTADLDKIDEKNLYEYYMSAIYSSPIDIFVTGNMEEAKIHQLAKETFDIKLKQEITYPTTHVSCKVEEVKNVEEKMEIAQGKLSLGFRTKVTPRDKEYYSLIVYNGILGGGPHSKLFNNVREKMSLAYYVFSRLEKFKGLLVISSGIEIQNYQKALDEILKQIEEIKNGNISDYEFESTISSSINSIKSLKDHTLHMTDYYLSQLVGGTNDSFEDLIGKISAVRKEDVIAIAQQIELDTIYFLKNNA
jgi:predicted Zn-dependent peptidase